MDPPAIRMPGLEQRHIIYTSRARGLAPVGASPQTKLLAAQEKPATGCHPPPCHQGQFWPRHSMRAKAVPKARLHQQVPAPWGPPRRRPADAAALRAATLQGSFKLLLRFTGDKPSQVLCPPPCTPSLSRMLCFCPWRMMSKSVQQGSNGGLVLGAWLSLLPVTLAGGSPSLVQMDSGYAKQAVLDPLRNLLTRPLSFPFHPPAASKRSGT